MFKIIKSPLDQREYRSRVLDNGLKVMLISDAQIEQASAALDIQIGSGHNPIDRQGLAHFLEHVLFLGTQKYPETGGFQQFIGEHAGRYNASTGVSSTHYFFKIPAQFLAPALDQFSQFFIAPLFDAEAIGRERLIVHSEFEARKKDDESRLSAAKGELLNPRFPGHRFSAGNQLTLEDREGQSVQDDLIKFYRSHYYAQQMALVVVGPHSLDQLQDWVEQKFDAIASKAKVVKSFDAPLVSKHLKSSKISIKPLKNSRELTFCFPVKSDYAYLKAKPLEYLMSLLGHQGKGSLLALFKSRLWADSIQAGLGYHDEVQAMFEVKIGLSERGMAHIDDIAESFFSMIKLIRARGITHAYFEELKQIASQDFKFQDKPDEADLAKQVARALHRFTPDTVLSAPELFEQFDPNTIEMFLNQLQPDNVQLIIHDPALSSQQHTQWYQVDYAVDSIPESTLTSWRNAALNAALNLPLANRFIPSRFQIKPRVSEHSTLKAAPLKLLDTPGIKLWHQTEAQLNPAKAVFHLALCTSFARQAARNDVLTGLFISLLNAAIERVAYSASIAGLDCQINQNEHGFDVHLSGYFDCQSVLLSEIIDLIQTLEISEGDFDDYSHKARLVLENKLKQHPFQLALAGVKDALCVSGWSVNERLSALKRVDVEMLNKHIACLLTDAHWRVLSVGAVLEKTSFDMGKRLTKLSPERARETKLSMPGVGKLKSGRWSSIQTSVNNSDTAIALVFQAGSKELSDIAAIRLLGKLIHPAYFYALRTREKLGYIVLAHALEIHDVPALAFSVQSHQASIDDIVRKTNVFLSEFYTHLGSFSAKAFAESKQGLLAQIMQKDKNLDDMATRYWAELDREAFTFDTREKIAKAIEEWDQAALCDYYRRLVLDDQARVLLSVCGEAQSVELSPELLKYTREPVSAVALRQSFEASF